METPTWTETPNQIADRIAGQFFEPTSLFHADLRRHIITAIEAEREVTIYYINQMGRWVKRTRKERRGGRKQD